MIAGGDGAAAPLGALAGSLRAGLKVRRYRLDEHLEMAFGKWQQAPQPPQLWRLLVMLGAVIATIVWLERYAALHAH